MEADHQVGGRLCFGVFEVDLRAGELRKRGLRVRLQQQPFQVLAMLLEHAGQVVGREELQKRLWPADTFVDFDHGLNKAINKIREALGDSAESPRFVETVGRRGYRFLADVRVADPAPCSQPGARTSTSARGQTLADREDPAGTLPTAHASCDATCVEDIGVRAARVLASLAAWQRSSGNLRRRSSAPWLSFRWKAFRTMRPRITSLTG